MPPDIAQGVPIKLKFAAPALALALTGCATLPTASGSLHPAVLTQPIGTEFNGGTVVFDETARGEHTFEIPYELSDAEAISMTIVCPQESGAVEFAAQKDGADLWSGSTASCDSDFGDKYTFSPGAPNSTQDWSLTVTTDSSVEYRVILCAEDI